MVLHLLTQGATLRLRQGRLLLEMEGAVLNSYPARQVRQVVVWGNVRLSTPALTFLLRQGIPVLFLSTEGFLYGVAASYPDPHPEHLRAQFAQHPLPLARAFVLGKLRTARVILERLGLPGSEAVEEALAQAQTASHLDALRGAEGFGSRAYFGGLSQLLRPWGFQGRSRRPPKDLVNAALSYGYALLLGRALLAVRLAGLHPEVGFLHAEGRRNPALALDLMEEFRIPVVDQVVITALRRGQLKPEHGEPRNGGVYLTEEGKRALIPLLEERFHQEATHPLRFRKTYAELLDTQAARLKAAILKMEPYTPYYLK
ncbi:CRISPR-associated endonuclease Cas1 [Thermus sp. SYSU G05001]|uniref:CRISPR-associated endonuclease Cas1 n=1 Tax=Thermus brevis TaxID=2862456 RepID=A0ABS6ZX97_9DEIN|nr:CRISPR-associated endonuclease Cas1 [Thermus brevis]MBW6394675.1 CRISPR-associated endonuclease Cas1 [Thermus brevis]